MTPSAGTAVGGGAAGAGTAGAGASGSSGVGVAADVAAGVASAAAGVASAVAGAAVGAAANSVVMLGSRAARTLRGKPLCARKARAGVNHGPSRKEAPHDSSPVTRRTQHILEVVECREWRVSPVFSLYISFSTRAVTLISVVCKGRTHRHKSHTRHTHTHSSQLSHSSHVTADSATHSTTQRRFSFSL